MHIDPYIVLGSAVVGLLVGMTGAGGGALMTPMLILLFGVKAPAAISSDLVAARRPTVTTALSELSRRGLLQTDGETWMLFGEAPGELLAFARDAGRRAGGTAHRGVAD